MSIPKVNLATIKNQAKDYDYIRFTWSDFHGIARAKTVPIKQIDHALEGGVGCFLGNVAFGPRSELTLCKRFAEEKYRNIYSKPVSDKVTCIPWAGGEKYKVGEVICEPMWTEGTVQDAAPRHVARKQLDRLKEMGFQLMSACEQEFLFAKDGKPLFDGTDFCTNLRFSDVEELMFDIEHNMQECGVEAETLHVEYSPGQVEMSFKPKWNIDTADDMFLFKNGVKEFTKQKGITSTFMSKPFHNDGASSGMHFNHSLWTADGKQNVFHDAKKPDRLSDIALYWIGGVIKHMDAITALCCPTVNCYRRLHTPWAADKKDWDYDSRINSWRVKSESEKATYMENRIPSGASNIYLVMAGTVAAGIDGIKNKISPPPKGPRDDMPLPNTLQEALDALEADTAICEALGGEFVEWFLCEKRTVELEKFGKHDIKQVNLEEFEAEQKEYFEMI